MNHPLVSSRPSRSSFKRIASSLLALGLLLAQVAPTYAACAGKTLPGANVSGGEFNGGAQPRRYGYDYIYPAQAEVDLLKKLNLKLMRVPILWERIQYTPSGPLDEAEMTRLDAVVKLATNAGMTIVLDVHNYGFLRDVALGDPASPPYALPDLWRRIALRYARYPDVAFGLMNEPFTIQTGTWAAIVRQTLDAIRATGSRNMVLIPGTNWDGAHSWQTPFPTLSNASTLLPVGRNDPNVAFEVHQYFDDWYSGTHDTCSSAAAAVSALASIGTWARANHVKLFLGEFGVSQRPECVQALDNALKVIERDSDVWYGWAYWTAGAWWGTYMFNIQVPGGVTPQGNVLGSRATALNTNKCAAATSQR